MRRKEEDGKWRSKARQQSLRIAYVAEKSCHMSKFKNDVTRGKTKMVNFSQYFSKRALFSERTVNNSRTVVDICKAKAALESSHDSMSGVWSELRKLYWPRQSRKCPSFSQVLITNLSTHFGGLLDLRASS